MISYHGCSILFVESKLLDSAQTQGEGIIQGHDYPKVRMVWGHLTILPHLQQMLIITKNKEGDKEGIFEKLCSGIFYPFFTFLCWYVCMLVCLGREKQASKLCSAGRRGPITTIPNFMPFMSLFLSCISALPLHTLRR